MTISVVIPLYNNEHFVADAIQSVLNQTYEDWQLIIVDDCSTDKSFDIAKEYFDKDERILLLKNDSNKGIGYTRNKGIKASKGEFISFLSSDDVWKPDFLEKMMANLKEGIIFCDYDIILANGGKIRTEKVMPEDNLFTYPKQNFEKMVKLTAKEETLFVNYSCILGERKYFEGENKFLDELRFGEDLHHIVRICNKAPFTYLPESLTLYRWHKNNTTHKVAHLMGQNNQKIFKLLREEGVDI